MTDQSTEKVAIIIGASRGIGAGLVDEHSIWIFPVVLGHGKRLFENSAPAHALELAESKTSGTGVIMNIYRPKGAVKVGSFALAESSPAEAARQAKMAKEG